MSLPDTSERRGRAEGGAAVGASHRRASVLLVEDEPDVAQMIRFNLRKSGFNVHVLSSGDEVEPWLAKHTADVVVLDVMLPGMDGFAVCRQIREMEGGAKKPVLMLTAKGEAGDRIKGFEHGADDYLVKPFHPRELALRLEALLRRTSDDVPTELVAGRLRLDSRRMHAELDGQSLQLTRIEFRLLWVLVERRGEPQDRDTLLKDVWGYQRYSDTRTVDTHMRRLRAKLGPFGDRIETVRGEGYRFSAAG